jgi:hypothetical protein
MTGDKIYSKVEAQLCTVRALGDSVAVSGGLALHLISPQHIEDKHLHDHSDVDLFVLNKEFFERIKALKFSKVWSKYDTTNFHRYSKTISIRGVRVKVLIDAFVDFDTPTIRVQEYNLVAPDTLIRLYKDKTSGKTGA